MSSVTASFGSLVQDRETTEQDVQEFLESHSEMIPLRFLLNHGLHLNAVLSKFPISTNYIPDLTYLTKSSGEWWAVFIELESPHKRVFTASREPRFTQEFNAAYDQVTSWRAELSARAGAFKDSLGPLLVPPPMRPNPIRFKYILIIGKDHAPRTRQHTGMLNERNSSDLAVLTYDSLLRWVHHNRTWPHVVLKKRKSAFEVKPEGLGDTDMFAYLNPGELVVPGALDERFTARGYDLASWRGGAQLIDGRSAGR